MGTHWPEHARFLIPGVNDTWNDYQRLCKGMVVTGKEWKAARRALHEQYQTYLAEGGEPTHINVETHRLALTLLNSSVLGSDLILYPGRVRLSTVTK